MNNEENMNNEEKNINTNNNDNLAENTVNEAQAKSVAVADENKKSFVPYIIIGVCAVAALGIGLLVGKKITKNKQLAAAQEYIKWEAQNHTWVEATCEAPKTCSVCGITEGEALGHEWMAATLDAPKTCKNCGATEGGPLELKQMDFSFASLGQFTSEYRDKDGNEVTWEDFEHLYIDVLDDMDEDFWTKDSEVTTGSMRAYVDYIISDEGIVRYTLESVQKLVRTSAEQIISTVYDTKTSLEILDYEGNIIKTMEIRNEQSNQVVPDCRCSLIQLDENPYIYTEVSCHSTDGVSKLIDIFDADLNKLNTESSKDYMSFDISRKTDNGSFMTERSVNMTGVQAVGKYIIFYYSSLDSDDKYLKENTVIFDIEKKQWVSDELREEAWKEIEAPTDEKADVSFDTSGYYYVNYNSAIDGYMVGTQDKSRWGYLDKDGNEIAMYSDATDFCDSGYALVSDDCKTYDLIDRDFNVIGKDVFEGTSVSWSDINKLFYVYKEDGTVDYYKLVTSE